MLFDNNEFDLAQQISQRELEHVQTFFLILEDLGNKISNINPIICYTVYFLDQERFSAKQSSW